MNLDIIMSTHLVTCFFWKIYHSMNSTNFEQLKCMEMHATIHGMIHLYPYITCMYIRRRIPSYHHMTVTYDKNNHLSDLEHLHCVCGHMFYQSPYIHVHLHAATLNSQQINTNTLHLIALPCPIHP